jgi:hypothetical protein
MQNRIVPKGLNLLLALLILGSALAPATFAANEGDPIQIVVTDRDQQNPDVVALPDKGLWFVVWEDWRTAADPPDTNTGADVWGQFVADDGTLCGAPFLISDENNDEAGDSGNQTFPRVAYDQGDGRILVVWQDTRGNGVYVRGIEVTDCATFAFLNEQDLSYNPVYGGPTGLLSRSRPRISYDEKNDYFWLGWVEGRAARKTVDFLAFNCASLRPGGSRSAGRPPNPGSARLLRRQHTAHEPRHRLHDGKDRLRIL